MTKTQESHLTNTVSYFSPFFTKSFHSCVYVRLIYEGSVCRRLGDEIEIVIIVSCGKDSEMTFKVNVSA